MLFSKLIDFGYLSLNYLKYRLININIIPDTQIKVIYFIGVKSTQI